MPYLEELDQSMERFFDFQAVEDSIWRREPPYDIVYKAFLFPMHGPYCATPITIPVDSYKGHEHSIDDLDMTYWIKPSYYDHNVVDLTTTRLYIERYPTSGRLLPFPCTIYFEDQSNPSGRNRMLRHLDPSFTWRGNVVVVKHSDEETHSDMKPEDSEIVTQVMTQVLGAKLLPTKEVSRTPIHRW